MNKYQKCLMQDVKISFQPNLGNPATRTIDFDNAYITFTQHENVTITQHTMIIQSKAISRMYAIKKDMQEEFKFHGDLEFDYNRLEKLLHTARTDEDRQYVEKYLHYRDDPYFSYVIDFDEKIDKIKIVFKNDLADDLIFSVRYIYADKDAWYAKVAAEEASRRKAEFLKNAQVKHSTGNDLVNIYFQPCCDEYDNTTIVLYSDEQLMAKYKVDKEAFFKSIVGLAFGTYYYEVIQYDKNGRELVKTDKIKVVLRRPNYSGQHVIAI